MDFLSSLEPSLPFYDVQVKGMAISFLSFGAPLVICLCRENIKKIWSPLLETTFIICLDCSTLMVILLSWVKHLEHFHFRSELCAVLCRVEMSFMGQ